MRLTFSILWFEDDEDWLDSLSSGGLEKAISSWGFTPKIEFVNTPTEFNNHSPFKDFDLIIIDRTLEGYPEGEQFIDELRGNGIYTEVIFYTAGVVSDLWQAIHDKHLEGVFVSDRGDVLTKIEAVGKQSIRKVLDLDNMRGIVMAEVGELDHLLDDIIRIGMESLTAEQIKLIFRRFTKGATEQNEKRGNSLEEFSKNPDIEEMINLCDSNKRWQNYKRLRKYDGRLSEREEIGDYELEILGPRNFLAHGRPKPHEKGFLFKNLGKDYYFDDKVSLELRQAILGYKESFSEIIKILNNGQ